MDITFQGSLFAHDFLHESVTRLDDWRNLDAEALDAFEASVRDVFARFPIAGSPNDRRTDGTRTTYLGKPFAWRNYDPELFDQLHAWVSRDRRAVRLIEQSHLLPAERFFSAGVPDDAAGRARYAEALVSDAEGAAVVFLDPDNGVEVRSRPYGRKHSSKYIYWREVQALVEAGRSVLIYQHYPRESHVQVAQRLGTKLAECGRFFRVVTIDAKSVLYLLGGQAAHWPRMASCLAEVRTRWLEQFEMRTIGDEPRR